MGENGEFHNTSGPGWEGLGPSPAKDSKQQSERQARVFINGKCQSEISSAASLTSCLLYGAPSSPSLSAALGSGLILVATFWSENHIPWIQWVVN